MSGGFYKYRCKYFYTNNCPNWVWVNNAPCAACLAEGRDDEVSHHAHKFLSRDVVVPQVREGVLHYAVMKHSAHHELVESNDYDGQGQLPQTVMAQTAVRSHGLAITSRAGPSMSTLRDLGEI